MNILEQIKSSMDIMTKSEQKIAMHCIGNLKDFAFYSLDTLADKITISTASVIRFCRKLGFKGFKEFQDAVREDFRYQPDLPDKFSRTAKLNVFDNLLERVIESDVSCLYRTFDELKFERISDAVDRISGAKRVFTFGMRESYAMAHYAYTRFLTVRNDVYILNAGYNGEVEPLLSLTKDNVCVVFLFHRYTAQALEILSALKKQGVDVILITSPPCDKVEVFASVLLPCYVDAGNIKNTSIAPVCITDYLCNAVAIKNGEASLEYMKKSEELFKTIISVYR